jgi:ABC-type branched-subunit amino acid transport system substrate-binding protein
LFHRRKLLKLGGAAAGACIAFPALSQVGRRIVLGQSAPLSGPAASLGLRFKTGADMVFERVNAKGGINGRLIELQTLDDGYEPDRCKANTEQFVKNGVGALFGYIGTPTSLAALPLATQAHLPFFAPFTGAEALRAPFNRYVFHVRASYFDETAEIVKQSTMVGHKRIAVSRQDDAYGQAGLDGVVRALLPSGRQPVAVGKFKRNSTEVNDGVNAILNAQPDAIVQIGAYKSCAAFIRAARDGGFLGTFYNVSFVGTQALSAELKTDARGVIVSQVMPSPYGGSSSLVGDYLVAGKADLGTEFAPDYGSIEGFVAARALVEGLRRSGGRNGPDGLIAGLESMHDFNLGGFTVDFSDKKHTGSKFVEMTILTADGRVRR